MYMAYSACIPFFREYIGISPVFIGVLKQVGHRNSLIRKCLSEPPVLLSF